MCVDATKHVFRRADRPFGDYAEARAKEGEPAVSLIAVCTCINADMQAWVCIACVACFCVCPDDPSSGLQVALCVSISQGVIGFGTDFDENITHLFLQPSSLAFRKLKWWEGLGTLFEFMRCILPFVACSLRTFFADRQCRANVRAHTCGVDLVHAWAVHLVVHRAGRVRPQFNFTLTISMCMPV